MGGVFAAALRGLQERHPSIGDVRGLGCFWGIELVKDRATREPLVPFNATGETFAPVVRASKAALDSGLYLMTQDRKSTRLNSSHVSTSYAVFCLNKQISTQLGTASRRCVIGSSKLRSCGRRPGLTADERRRLTLLFGSECALSRLSSVRRGQIIY